METEIIIFVSIIPWAKGRVCESESRSVLKLMCQFYMMGGPGLYLIIIIIIIYIYIYEKYYMLQQFAEAHFKRKEAET